MSRGRVTLGGIAIARADDKVPPLDPSNPLLIDGEPPEGVHGRAAHHASLQGRTLVPISTQLELFCPPYNPTELTNVSWSCLS